MIQIHPIGFGCCLPYLYARYERAATTLRTPAIPDILDYYLAKEGIYLA